MRPARKEHIEKLLKDGLTWVEIWRDTMCAEMPKQGILSCSTPDGILPHKRFCQECRYSNVAVLCASGGCKENAVEILFGTLKFRSYCRKHHEEIVKTWSPQKFHHPTPLPPSPETSKKFEYRIDLYKNGTKIKTRAFESLYEDIWVSSAISDVVVKFAFFMRPKLRLIEPTFVPVANDPFLDTKPKLAKALKEAGQGGN